MIVLQAYLERAGEELGEVLGLATEYNPVDAHSPVAQSHGEIGECRIVEESFVQL
jgi:hypothetical protein